MTTWQWTLHWLYLHCEGALRDNHPLIPTILKWHTHLHLKRQLPIDSAHSLERTTFICNFNNANCNNESNLLAFYFASVPLSLSFVASSPDYPGVQHSILPSECLQYKINNWQRVGGCRVIIGCRRRLKWSTNTADSLVISFGLNENHGLNPSKEIRKMWAHYWCPLSGFFI